MDVIYGKCCPQASARHPTLWACFKLLHSTFSAFNESDTPGLSCENAVRLGKTATVAASSLIWLAAATVYTSQ